MWRVVGGLWHIVAKLALPQPGVMQGTNEDGEWGRASRQVLEGYEKNERSFQDANGRQLDLEIIDPESNLQQ